MSAEVHDDDLEPLVTECPYCRTRFRVSDQQLVAASGRVRCGACLQVFQGNAHLLFESEFESTEDANAALDELLDDLAPDDVEEDELAEIAANARDENESDSVELTAGDEVAIDTDELELNDWTGDDQPPTLPNLAEDGAIAEIDGAAGEPQQEESEREEEVLLDSVSARAISQAVATARAGLAADPDPDVLSSDWDESESELDDVVQAEEPQESEVDDHDLAQLAPELSDVREVDSLDELDALLSAEGSLSEAAEGSLPAEGSLSEAAEGSSEYDAALDDPRLDAENTAGDVPEPATSGSWTRFELVDDEAAARVDAPDSGSLAAEESQEVPEPAASNAAPVSPLQDEVEQSVDHAEPPGNTGVAEDSVAADDLAELLREMEPPRKRNWLAPVVIIGVVALIAEVLYLQFDQWSLNPTLRPVYVATCSLLPCELDPLRDLTAIRSLAHEFKPDPEDPDRMLLDLQFVSDADFAQPFPTIEVTFRARTGALVSTQSTLPEAYLYGDAAGLTELMPKTPVRITVSLAQVSGENYQIAFR